MTLRPIFLPLVLLGPIAAGCAGAIKPTAPISAAPKSAAPGAAPVDPLARARALLVPYDPGGASRDGIALLLELAKAGRKDAYALLARTYVDWTAYAAFAADVPLLTLVERDLGVEIGLGTTPFPLPAAYVERLRALARKGGVEAQMAPLLDAWAKHDLGVTYWKKLAEAVSHDDPAAILWALMDCEESLKAARRVPSGLAPWIAARGCALEDPERLPLLMDSDAAERAALLAPLLGRFPLLGVAAYHRTPEGAATLAALGRRAALLAAMKAAAGPLAPFAREALERLDPVPSLPATVAAVPTAPADPALPVTVRTAAGLWTEEGRVLVVVKGAAIRLAAKPLVAVGADGRPLLDFGTGADYPGAPVELAALGRTLDDTLADWEARGYGSALGPAAAGLGPAGGRAITIVADAGTPVERIGQIVAAAAEAHVDTFCVLAARGDGRPTEVPARLAVAPAGPPPPLPSPSLVLRVEARATTLVAKGLPGVHKVTVPHKGGAPDLPALYAAAARVLPVAEKARATLRAAAARGVRFGDLWDALDALRFELPGAPFASRAAFDAARFATGGASAASLPGAAVRRALSGPFTVVLER